MSAINQNTRSSLDAAGEYLEQAIKLDPSFGMAWSELASNVVVKAAYGFLGATEGYERVRQLAQHALQLSPDIADAHASLLWVLMTLDRDWAAAETEGPRALAFDPTNPQALQANGNLSYALGRWDDAERQFRSALLRDPLNTYTIFHLGRVYIKAGRFAEAEGLFRKVIELAPGFNGARSYLGKTLLAEGKPEAALAMLQEVDEPIALPAGRLAGSWS